LLLRIRRYRFFQQKMDPVNVKRAQLLRAILALGAVTLLPLVSKEAFWTRGRHDSAQMAHLRSTQSAGKSRFPRMPTTTTHALSASPKKNLVPNSIHAPPIPTAIFSDLRDFYWVVLSLRMADETKFIVRRGPNLGI